MTAIYHPAEVPVLRELIRWTAAGICVAALHSGAAWTALNWPRPVAEVGEAPAAVMIELAPLPVAPETPQHDVAIGPQTTMSEAVTPVESKDKPVEQEEPEPVPEAVEPAAEPLNSVIKTEIDTPPLPEITSSAAVLQPPTSSPPQKEKTKESERKPPVPKKVERRKPRERIAQNAPATAAPQAADVQRAVTNAAPVSGASVSMAPATWRSALIALLNRHKRFPPGGSRGTSHVIFTIDRTGRVLSARLIRSSGDATLDQEAVALARRVSPVPPPPPEIGSMNVSLAVPIRFNE